MYNFKKTGFSELPVGREAEYYKEKIDEVSIFTSDDLTDRSLYGDVEIAGVKCVFGAKINPKNIAHLVELSWERNDFSFEGIPLAGLSMEQLADALAVKGFTVEKDGNVLKLVDAQVSFFFYEGDPASIAWWLPSFYEANASI